MARPQKEGLDYFPVDIEMFTDKDDKTYILEAKYGLVGVALVIKLLQKIYSDKGYYKKWGEREALIFSKQVSIEINVVNNLINDCIKEGFFEKARFEKFGILTSKGIQKRYFEACTRRKHIEIIKEYMLVDTSKILNVVIDNINHINAGNNDVNTHNNIAEPSLLQHDVDDNPQSKVKNNIYTADFLQFYCEYPRPEDKNRTFTNWKTQLKKYSVDQLMAACKNYTKAKAGTEKQFLKSSANFLGKEKPFEDYINYQAQSGKSKYKDQTNYEPR